MAISKRILIITYYWPPSAGSGVQRWLKFAKYLPQYGWTPVIYTPENPDFNLLDESLLSDIPVEAEIIKQSIWEPYAIAKLFSKDKKLNTGIVGDGPNMSKKKKFMNWVRGNFFIPDPRVFWVKPSIKYLKKYLQDNPVDAIVTTGPPHSMHLIGLGLKKSMDIKWFVDIRDPWSKLDFLDTFYVSKRNRKKYEALESEVLNACDGVIATSYSMPSMLQPFDIEKFNCVTNGFDKQDFSSELVVKSEPRKSIKIYHAGLLNQVRDPVHLWKALSDCSISKPIEIHLVGNIDAGISTRLTKDINLGKNCMIEPYKSHKEVIEDYSTADILLLLVNDSFNAKVNIPGKLFEYIAIGTPILMIGDPFSDAAKIVKDLGNGLVFGYQDNIDAGVLTTFMAKAKQVKDMSDKEKHSRSFLTKKLIHILSQ